MTKFEKWDSQKLDLAAGARCRRCPHPQSFLGATERRCDGADLRRAG
jgi:hypothetical protein